MGFLFNIIFIVMKILIKENKLISVYQKVIDKCLRDLKLMADDELEIGDWVDKEILDDIHSVNSIKVNDVENVNEEYPGFTLTIIEIHVDTILNGIRHFDCFQIYYHLEYYLKVNMVGKTRKIQIKIIEDSLDLKMKTLSGNTYN